MNANDRKMTMFGIFVVIIAIIGAFVSEMPAIFKEATDTEIQWVEHSEVIGPYPGTLQEGGSTDEPINIDKEQIVSVSVTLTWQDDPNFSNRHTNQPDSFTLSLIPPNGAGEEKSSDTGSISIDVSIDENMTAEDYIGEWIIGITLDNAGDHTPIFGPLGLRDQPDNGNSYELDGKIIFLVEPEPEAGE